MNTARLRHTGMQIPDQLVRLLAPGLIEVDGDVHQIGLDVHDDFAEICQGTAAGVFYQWAAGCRDEHGDPLDLEDVFDYLRIEHSTERALALAASDGCTIVQAMLPRGEGYLPGMTLRVYPDDTRQHVIAVTEITGGPIGTWWRLFDGTTWVELDPK